MKNVELRTRRGLHAKVFLTRQRVVIGSANASANGLGQEGEEANNLEAVAAIHQERFRSVAGIWFEKVWKDSRAVTPKLIQRIRPAWLRRRWARPSRDLGSSSLLDVLVEDPQWFKDREVRLIAYECVEATDAAKARFDEIAADLYEPKTLDIYRRRRELPFYEDDGKWEISPGEYIIDFDIDREKLRAVFQGLWRVRSHDPFQRVNRNSRLILCDKARDFKGLRLHSSDVKRLGPAVFAYVLKNKFKKDRNGSMLDMPLDIASTTLLVN